MSDVEYEDGDINVNSNYEAGDVNEVRGALPKSVLEYVAKAIVDEPDSVEVDADEGRRGVELSLHVAPDDMGKVIGKRGRVAQAIRTVVRAAGAAEGVETNVDIVD
jgi:predicted RNA-binding protein YlqC (UPF0109 family)